MSVVVDVGNEFTCAGFRIDMLLLLEATVLGAVFSHMQSYEQETA
jgi:hypothetical protein